MKVITLGEVGSGKSSLLVRFADNEFQESQNATIGLDYKTKVVHVDGKATKLELWDTAGQERFNSM